MILIKECAGASYIFLYVHLKIYLNITGFKPVILYLLFEKGRKKENIDEIETGMYIYMTDISPHRIDSLGPVLTQHKQISNPYI